MENTQNIIRGRYKIIQEISRGGMGVVFLALDLLKNREVAVKKSFYSGAEQARKGFEIEAKLLARLEHEGLPKVLDYFFLEDNAQALVMDYIGGETLADILESGKFRHGRGLSAEKVLDWTIQLLDILRYLHNFEPPIVHRDIKPNNIKLTKTGKIILLDFGLAKGSAVTLVGGMSGYSPIEQIHRTGTDTRSDIYALGTTLFHLLADEYPLTALDRFREIYGKTIDSKTSNQSSISLKADPQKAIIELNRQVPEMVSEIVMKAMSLMPENRFQSADEMKSEVLKAKRSLEYGISKVGAITNVDGFTDLEKRRSLIEENEENLTVWETRKDEKKAEIKEKIAAPTKEKDLRDTVSSAALFGESFENDLSQRNLIDDISFAKQSIETPIFLPKQDETKTGKPKFALAICAIALILLTSLGIFAWYFLSIPKQPQTATLQPNIPADLSTTLSKKDETPKNLIEITKYGIGKNSKLASLDENHQFALNEEFKFGITATQEGFLYIVSRDSNKNASIAFPQPHQKDNLIKQDTEKIFPQDQNFELKKDSPAETWVYFVLVSRLEDDLAKRILETLDSKKDKRLSDSGVSELFADLDKLADNSAKNNQENEGAANKPIVGVKRIQKK